MHQSGPKHLGLRARSEIKYNEWSKHAQLFACYVVVMQSAMVLAWNFGETRRQEAAVALATGKPLADGVVDMNLLDEVSATDASMAIGLGLAIGGTAVFAEALSSSLLKHLLQVEGGCSSRMTVSPMARLGAAYVLFIALERSNWCRGPPADMVRGHPTTWTIARHDGPNYLGLWYNTLPEHQLALITPGCAPSRSCARRWGPTARTATS